MKLIIKTLLAVVLFFQSPYLSGQGGVIEGYTFETGNRGYLSKVDIQVIDISTQQTLVTTTSGIDGRFILDLPPVTEVLLKFNKEMFKAQEQKVVLKKDKTFLKVEMERAPGYLFEITLADKREDVNDAVDAILGALIEVFNNTTEKLVLRLEDHADPEFKLPMEKGNHYTILVRKKGYLAKQMEAFVNVKGCILCFEGISNVRPGVTDNLTSGNEYGSLLANVEMDKIFSGKSFDVENIYYDLNSAELKKKSKKELDKVINLLRFNPNLTLELGSHTDSRGKRQFNMKLSKDRALSAVNYVINTGGIPKYRILAAGYGETQIRNGCIDGVKCSEAKHKINRRTEIKIVGIDEDWIFKPLVNIKNEIKMEKEIFKMIHGENQQVSEEEYAKLRQIEKQSSLPVASSRPTNALDRNSDIVILEAVDEIMDQEIAEENARKKEEEELLANKKAKGRNIIDVKEKNEVEKKTKNKMSAELEVHTDSLNIIDRSKDNEEVVKEIMKEEVDMPDDAVVMPPKMKNGITDGYKIVILYSGVPLPKDNPIFEKHQNIETYISAKKYYYYMLPGYKSSSQADDAINDGIKNTYPGAYVAGFKNGERIL